MQQLSGLAAQERRGSIVDIERALGEQKGRAFRQLIERVRSRLELRHRPHEECLLLTGNAEHRRHQVRQSLIVRLANVMPVEVLELLEVESRRRLSDVVEVEPLDRLAAADDLVVAMAPAEAQQ